MRFEFKTCALGLMTMRVIPEDASDCDVMRYWSDAYSEFLIVPLYASGSLVPWSPQKPLNPNGPGFFD